MSGRPTEAAGDEITVGGLVFGMAFLVPGAFVLAIPPVLAAFSRIGYVGTTLFIVGIVALSIAFFLAYERIKPSVPATPRRDLVVTLFAALLTGLWTFLFTNAVVAVVVLGGLGAIVLLPDSLRQWFADHLPW